LSLQAQKTKPQVEYQNALTLSPLMLLGPDFTLTLGYEHRLKHKLVFSPELGFILGSAYYSTENDSKGSYGFLFRPSLRFFVNEERNFYIQPQLFYKMVDSKLHDWLGKECENDVPAFEQLQDFTYRRQAYGFNMIAGVLVPTKGRKLLFDFYFGLGVRHKTGNVVGEPRSCYDGGGPFFGTTEDDGTFPNVPAGVRLVFVLK
jgi:hypothetical protein